MNKKTKNHRDYDAERNELFGNTLKSVNPRIQKTLDLIEKLNPSEVSPKYRLSTSCSSTSPS